MGSRKITDLLLPGAYSLGSDFLAKTVSEEEKRKYPFHDVAQGGCTISTLSEGTSITLLYNIFRTVLVIMSKDAALEFHIWVHNMKPNEA